MKTVAEPAKTITPERTTIYAIGLVCAATVIFSFLDATAKYLAEVSKLPVSQIIWIRFMAHIAIMIVILGPLTIPRHLKSNKPGHQILRSFFMLGATAANFVAVKYLQLDQTVTIFFITPLLVAALAGPFLGEWVGWRRLLAILVGFSGVILVTRPGFGGIHPAIIFSFLAAFSFGCYNISTRYLSHHDTSQTTFVYSPFAGAIAFAIPGLLLWEWPNDMLTWALLLSLGITGGFGHWLIIIAHKYAPAPVLAPFIYIGLISMIIIGYVVFDDVPTMWTLSGGLIVITAGLYLLYRESKVKS